MRSTLRSSIEALFDSVVALDGGQCERVSATGDLRLRQLRVSGAGYLLPGCFQCLAAMAGLVS